MSRSEFIERRIVFEAVVIGASAGGLGATLAILSKLPENYSLPIVIVQHLARNSKAYLVECVEARTAIRAKEAESGESLEPGQVYYAPAAYHLLIEENRTLSLSVDLPVNFSIPSIDVLFESAAECYGEALIGIILTGANSDGAEGLKFVKSRGGITIVQDPEEAEVSEMPQAALRASDVDHVYSLDEIAAFLKGLDHG